MRVDVQPIEQRLGRLDAGLLVIERADAAVDERRGRRLAEVVADRAEHHGDAAAADRGRRSAARASSITISVCDPDVAFGMPLRLLLAADQRPHLGQHAIDDAEVEREREPDRRPCGLEQQLLDLAPDPLGGQIVERDRAAQRARVRRRA